MNLIYGNYPETLDVSLAEKDYKQFHVVIVKPEKNMYRFSNCFVNINDKRIDKETVATYCGFNEDDFDAEEFAVACVEFYGERFWGGYHEMVEEEEAKKIIKEYLN